MRKVTLFICLSVFVLGSSSVASAQTSAFFETQIMTPDVHDNLTFDGGLGYQLSENWKLRSFFLVKGLWAQAHFGPVWQPLGWLALGISFGGRQGPDGIDLQTSYLLGLNKGRVSFTGQVEVGRLGYSGDDSMIWYDLTLRIKTLKWLTLGLKDRRPAGVGPLVEFHFWQSGETKASRLTVWVAWVPLDSEEADFDWARALLGLKICL